MRETEINDVEEIQSPANREINCLDAARQIIYQGGLSLVSHLVVFGGEFGCSVILAEVDTDHLAASALINTIRNLFVGTSSTLLFSAGVSVRDAAIQGDGKKIGKILRQCWGLSIILSVPVIATAFSAPLLESVGQSQSTSKITQDFFRGYIWGVPFLLAVGSNNQVFFGLLSPMKPLITYCTQYLLTLGLGYSLVFGTWGMPRLGALGMGYAHSIAAGVVFVGSTAYMTIQKTKPAPFSLFDFRHNEGGLSIMRGLVQLGGPIALQTGAELLSYVFCLQMIGLMGEKQLAAAQIALQYGSLVFIPTAALALTNGILVREHVVHNQLVNAKTFGNTAMMLGIILPSTMLITFAIAPKPFAEAFSDDTQIDSLASKLLLIIGAGEVMDSVRYVASGSLRGFLDTAFSMKISMLATAFSLGLAYVLGFPLGLESEGVLGALEIGVTAMAGALFGRWFSVSRTSSETAPLIVNDVPQQQKSFCSSLWNSCCCFFYRSEDTEPHLSTERARSALSPRR